MLESNLSFYTQKLLDILWFKLCFDNKSFSKGDKNNILMQIVSRANEIYQ